jgi:hypothetical protein
MKPSLLIGGGMLSLFAFFQVAPYDLGDVGTVTREVTDTAGGWANDAISAVQKGAPLTTELIWFAAVITFVKVVLDSQPVRTLSADRAAKAQAERDEAKAKAEHGRSLELLQAQRDNRRP